MRTATRIGAIAAAVLSLLFASAAGAGASRPDKFTFEGGFSLPDTSICGFSVLVTETSSNVIIRHEGQAGTHVLAHATVQDSFSANGVTLVGEPYRQTISLDFSPSGDLEKAFTVGVYEKLRLPDGSLFIAAGRLDLLTSTQDQFILTPDNGVVRNQDAFCAALSG
jgi:hypothetical protein